MPDRNANPWSKGGRYWNSSAVQHNPLRSSASHYSYAAVPRRVLPGDSSTPRPQSISLPIQRPSEALLLGKAATHGVILEGTFGEYDKPAFAAALDCLQRSPLFKALYAALNSSENIFTVRRGRTIGNSVAQFLPNSVVAAKGGVITLSTRITTATISAVYRTALAEEFMHAYQNEHFAEQSVSASNNELEAKVFTRMVLNYELGTGSINTHGTSTFLKCLEDTGVHTLRDPAFFESENFLAQYQIGLNEFVSFWKAVASSGGHNYPSYTATPSSHPPLSLIKIMKSLN